ncbi:MAG: hypothetical protein HY851_05710 [candidate division Zixibacteria bacterium]|nr:hypothetical protein [candidate division Zixibacteria bacterium]
MQFNSRSRLTFGLAALSAIAVTAVLSCSKKPTEPTFPITASAGAHGSISPSGTVSVRQGGNQTFTITPDSGYLVFDVNVDNTFVGPVSTYTFTNVTASHTIHAAFVQSVQPDRLSADNGLYYKGLMDSSTLLPQLVLRATDAWGNRFANRWIRLIKLAGSGVISADSLITDSEGAIRPTYTFSGQFGHAVLRAILPQTDTLDLYLRANTMLWGDSAQGEYIKFGDQFSFIKKFDGMPERIDVDPNAWLTYAVYENTRGVVAVLEDININSMADEWEPVVSVILTMIYPGRFRNGVGINSTIYTPGVNAGAVDSAFGLADTVYFDAVSPEAWAYVYRAEGITFFADQQTPRRVFEIHLFAPQITQPFARRFSTPTVESVQ